MITVFIGGSRHVSRLSAEAKGRLKNIIDSGFKVIVGDANGADKAVQKYMADAAYKSVTIYCSGDRPRNNLGPWPIESVAPPEAVKGFQFYAAKDREMAAVANFGFMIWDGKSSGTILNILRLVRAGKKAVLLNVPEKQSSTFRNRRDWEQFLGRCGAELVSDLRQRATPEEWLLPEGEPILVAAELGNRQLSFDQEPSEDALTDSINSAFAEGDMSAVVDLLGSFAKVRGMANVAKDAGLSRESLYRSLSADGNPEFSTILKVIESLGLRLSVTATARS